MSMTLRPEHQVHAEYYRQRASEYDAVYRKPERQAELALLREMLPPLVGGLRVLEIAAGTGYWTQVLARSAASIVATDLNPETLAMAGRRSFGDARVQLLAADAYDLGPVLGETVLGEPVASAFDLVFCGFWWSHVLRADIPSFLGGLRSQVGPGTSLILLDNRYVSGSSQPVSRTGPGGDTYQQRRLGERGDGGPYEVVKNFPDRAQLTADLAAFAAEVTWTELEYYWLATAVLA